MTKVEKKRVSILGCGWLGFPLAQRLLTHDISLVVKGSTTSDRKLALFESEGIIGYQFDLTPNFNCADAQILSFMNCDTLVIAIPPKTAKHGQNFHVHQIQAIVHVLASSSAKEIIYISSTSVYPQINRVLIEDDVYLPEQSASPAMVRAENLLIALRPEKTVCILRLGGLMGYERIPGKYVRGQKDMTTGSIPVNYIHRDDAAKIIAQIIESGIKNETFNIVAPLHPTRKEVYVASCEQFGWESPTFITPDTPPDFKIISSEKLTRYYNHDFRYPNPLLFHYESKE